MLIAMKIQNFETESNNKFHKDILLQNINGIFLHGIMSTK